MPTNVPTTVKLCSFHMLVSLLAMFQQRANQELPNVQMGFEEAEEPEIKFPTFTGSWRKQESSRKTSTST